MPDSCGHGLLLEMSERNEVLSIPQEALKQKLWVTGSLSSVRGIRVKIPAASGGALEGRSLSCWGNLSPKPPNKDAIPPHRKQWGILASFREPYTGHTWCLLSWEAQYTIIGINSNVPWSKNIGLRVKTRRTMKTRKVKSSWN